jgi:hypothetical protein
MSTVRVKDIILDRISVEIFLGHNAIAVYVALSDHSHTLNYLQLHRALGTIQRHALDAFILSLCKLYEKPDNRYPNFSIPTTIRMLQEDLSCFTNRVYNSARLERFVKANIDSNFSVRTSSDISLLPELILNYFSEQYPRTPPREGNELDLILDALKVLRDKRVAHHEDADLSSFSKTDIAGAQRLLAFAQTYVNLVGYGLFGFTKEAEVGTNKFDPQKSVVWPEMEQIIGLLEQSN